MARRPFFRRTFRITRVRQDASRDAADEIDFYLDMRTQELVEEGLSPEEARRRAEAAFGDRREVEETCVRLDEPMQRRRRRSEISSAIFDDVRRGVRDLRRYPAFAVTACLTLAVCIGLWTTVFTVVHSIVLAPLPFPEPDRLVSVYNVYPNAGHPRASCTVPEYFDRQAAISAFDDLALYQIGSLSVGEPGAIQRLGMMRVTASFFRVLEVPPILGQTFADDAMAPGHGTQVVLSYGLWQELYGGDPEVLGQELRIEGVSHEVVAVMPDGFRLPNWSARLWLPLELSEELKSFSGRYQPYYQMIARLRDSASIGEAQSQLDAWNETLVERVPAGFAKLITDAGFFSRIVGLQDDQVRYVKPWLYLLWAGSFFVVLIGGVSLANLMLMRATGRMQELATRQVLGARRWRLIVQLLAESLVLAVLGGVAGLAVGAWSLRLFDVFSRFELPRAVDIGLDVDTAALILSLALAVTLAASLVATLAVQRRHLFAVLRGGASTLGRGARRLRDGLAAVQVAVACILLVGAALTSLSLWRLLAVDPGFATEDVFVGSVNLPRSRYAEPADRWRFYDALIADLSSLPGVTGVALTNQVPLTGDFEKSALTAEGVERTPGEEIVPVAATVATPSYFSVMEIPLLAGRLFDDTDDMRALPVLVVSEDLARSVWGSADEALGRRVRLDAGALVGEEASEDDWRTVIGVVGDVVQRDLTESSRAGGYYIPYQQQRRFFVRLLVKTEGRPSDMTSVVRDRILALDPEVVLFWVSTLEETVATSLLSFRIPMQLLMVFACVALLLAAIGVYGVLAQSVAQSTKEISLRMVLGSTHVRTFGWVVRHMLVIVGAGLFLGLLGGLSFTHVMTHLAERLTPTDPPSLIHGVSPTDPAVFLAVALVVGAVAVLAALVPARRAMRIEPARALVTD